MPTRARAAALTGAIGGRAAVETLVRLLHDPAAEVRASAAHALGKLEHWPAAASLAALLRDPAWDVRRAAALALRAMGAPGLLLLRRSTSDEDRFARDIARQALELPGLPRKATTA
jgi:HEAT repeat protein